MLRTCSDAVLDAESFDEMSVSSNVPADLDCGGAQHFWTVHVDDLRGQLVGDEGHVERRNSRPVYTAVSCERTHSAAGVIDLRRSTQGAWPCAS